MTLPARYSGLCPACGERWQPGDLIRAEARTGSPGADDIWQHAVCPDAPDPLPAARPGEVACPACWLIHPEGACDA